MNNPFEYMPDAACDKAFKELLAKLELLKGSKDPDDINFIRELEEGKMLGVLIAADKDGKKHKLYAFSGQIGNKGFHHDGFVEPVFDYLQPDGYFRTKEAEISHQNNEITKFENETLAKIKNEYENVKNHHDSLISEFKEKCRLSKLERKAIREAGIIDDSETAALIRRSQFEKAELHRLKKRLQAELDPHASKLRDAKNYLDSLKEKRRAESESLQNWLFTNFRLLNAHGDSKNLLEIFKETAMNVPPSGAGECCAPKLLHYSYRRGWTPIVIAEYWYGKSKDGEVRRHGDSYPACRGKCLPVLSWMLQGLDIEPPLDNDLQLNKKYEPEIIYENQWFCVVNKPAGMLSVPGKITEVSLQQWLQERYGHDRNVKMAHRLDQDTSGLIVATFGELAFKTIQALFASRKIKKRYVADLEGDFNSNDMPRQGHIDLPLSPDWLDRPRQRVDFENGKTAVTDYEIIGFSEGCLRVIFYPLTGRTHQLRVHSASEMGLGMPIIGDRIYGKNDGRCSGRLHLHAQNLEFTFPIDGKNYCFESKLPF